MNCEEYSGGNTSDTPEPVRKRRQPHVLVVARTTDKRRLLAEELEPLEATVDTAECGQEAFDQIQRARPALLVADVGFPDEKAQQLCSKFGQSEATMGIAMIMVLSRGDQNAKISAFENGASDYLLSPFERGALCSLASSVLGRVESNRGRVVACVERDPGIRLNTSRILRAEGYAIRTFQNAASFLERLRETLPDLLLLDLQLADHGAYRIIEEMRRREALAAVPIIATTHSEHRRELVNAHRAGARDFIRKPFFREELIFRVENQLAAATREADLMRAATADTLTGLSNRAELMRQQDLEVGRSLGDQTPLGVLMVDIDHFKKLNDNYGHSFGDEVLRCVAQSMRGAVRAEDCVARYGGEEFTVLCRRGTASGLRFVAERIRSRVEALQIENDTTPVPVTVSIGGYSWHPSDLHPDMSLDQIVGAADENLYAAKHGGRNQAIVSKSSGAPVLAAQHSAGGLLEITANS